MDVKRLTELDGLRGIAALAVVFFHYMTRYDKLYGHDFRVPELFALGSFGVHLFFIVSGFVIYWTISRSEKPLDFIWSRFSRLYPPFWVAVILTFTIVAIFSLPNREVDFTTFTLNFVMFHEYFGVKHVDGVYWTLTIELSFYFWILTLFCFGQIKHIEKILIAWIILATLLTYHKFNIYLHNGLKKLLLLDYIELFAAGICFYKYKSKTHSKLTHAIIFLSIISLYFSYSYKVATLLCCFYLVFVMIVIDKAKIFRAKLFVYFGTISYSLYLIHQNIGYVIINKFYSVDMPPLIGLLMAFCFSVLLAHMILVFVERPSLNKLRKIYKDSNRFQSFKDKLLFLLKTVK